MPDELLRIAAKHKAHVGKSNLKIKRSLRLQLSRDARDAAPLNAQHAPVQLNILKSNVVIDGM